MKKRRRRRRSPPKVSRYRRVVGRLPHSMVALAVVTVGLTFGLASVGWAIDGKPLLAGRTNTATQPTVLDKAGAGPALDLQVDSGAALAVNTPALVTNLNADQLDGMGENAFAKTGHKHSGADITSGKVGESFIDDAITRDSEVPSLVGDSFATQSALNDEEAARKAADAQLQNNIDNETAARQAADTTLQSNINAEANARQNAGQTLQANIDSESAARAAADNVLQNNIDQEASTRQVADNALGQGDGAANESSDPVDFTKVKNIPADVINRNADTIDGKNSSDFASAYKRTVVVSPVPNNPFASGAALESALAGITGASQSDPYLLKIEPGVYNLGGPPGLQMKQWVDIEGSGEVSTKITCSCGAANTFVTEAVVKGANNAELRFLTVDNTGGGPSAPVSIAIRNEGVSPRLTHVTTIASGGGGGSQESFGVFNNNSSPRMSDVTARALGGGVNYGVSNEIQSSPQMTDVTATGQGGNHTVGVWSRFNSSPRMTDVTATGSGGAILNRGVYNEGNSPQMSDVTAIASGGGASLGSFGVFNNRSSPQMTDVTGTASGSTESNGVRNLSSSPVIEGGTFKASEASNSNIALAGIGGANVQVNNAHMIVPTSAAGGKTVLNSAGGSTRIGASLLEGAGVQNDSSAADSLKCVASYNGNYDPLGADCT